MNKRIYRLYPPPFQEVELQGLYLGLGLDALGTPQKPFVYANFLSSLDGRIALEDPLSGHTWLPKSLTTPDDFRLFLELEAQADCLITHGGYMRSLAAGRLGNILQVGLRPGTEDLAHWRRERGLSPQPAVVIASASLDFPMHESLAAHGQTCFIATGATADPWRIAQWQARGYEVLRVGQGDMVDGAQLVSALGERGYRRIYLIAGPHMLDTMIRNGKLDRLFETITHQLMGGQTFRTVTPGPELGPFGHLKMRSLYYDPTSPADTGQWFVQFDNLPAGAKTLP